MTEKIRILAESIQSNDFEWKDPLSTLLAKIEDLIKDVPPEHRAEIVFNWENGGDGEPSWIELFLYRDQTDEEAAAEQRWKKERMEQKFREKEKEKEERNTYETLKRKFEQEKK